jgi:ABC-type uncharacterized transport system involved in gliding motility auxiliary subunit
MTFNWIKARQTKYTAYAAVYTVVIVAVLGIVNFLANRYNKTFDTTANKQFSLSDQTVKVTSNLKKDISISYFGEQTQFPQAKDLLGRYQTLSPHIKVDYIDPVKKPQQARAAGYRRDVTILVDSGLRKEEAKSLSEEELTGAVIRSLKTGERNVCFVTGFREAPLEESATEGSSVAKQLLERDNYKTRSISLAPQTAPGAEKAGAAIGQAAAGAIAVPKDCTVLVVAGPKLAYPAPVVDALKSYVENGGHALFLLDTPLNLGRERATEDSPELLAVLAGWGVTLNKDLALDLSGTGALFGLGPEVALLGTYESHAIVRDLKGAATAFPMARTLEVKNGEKTTVEKLFGTTEDSVAVTSIPAGGRVDPSKGRKGPLTLAAAGTFQGTQQGRFVVVGTSQWVVNSLLGSRRVLNRDLLLNMLNWLTADEDLISIRPREAEDRRLDISGQKMNMLFWLSVVFFPLAVVGFGLATWWKRR